MTLSVQTLGGEVVRGRWGRSAVDGSPLGPLAVDGVAVLVRCTVGEALPHLSWHPVLMVFDSHPELPPVAPDTVVWRYMDLARFLALLEDKALYFARSDLMTDPWEGSFGEANAMLHSKSYEENYPAMQTQMKQLSRTMRTTIYLNCWHAASVESAAMWGLYQRDGRGIAVRTTWGRLIASIRSSWTIFGGRVNYVDYQNTIIPEGQLFSAYMYKRLSFSFEHEVRLLLWSIMAGGPAFRDDSNDESVEDLNPEAGYRVEVDLRELTDTIHIAPEAPDWFADLIKKLLRRYMVPWTVMHSDLARDPIW